MKLEDLYKQYAKKVHQYAYYLSGNKTMAEDITSETFIRAWVSIDRIRESTVNAYLSTIARNYYFELQKSKKSFGNDLTINNCSLDSSELLSIENDLRTVLSAMQLLKEKERSALLLRARNDLSYQEIAEVLNLTISNSKVLVCRARMKLKKILKKQEEKNYENYT